MARALIVGCGTRGLELGRTLRKDGWQVRGTTRDPARAEEIEAAGIEAAIADPDRAGTILDHVGDVTVVVWLLGSAAGGAAALAAIHGPRLERIMERLVDTPVRGFVYEAAGTVPSAVLDAGAAIVLAAAERWRIPVRIAGERGEARGPSPEALHDAVLGVIGAA